MPRLRSELKWYYYTGDDGRVYSHQTAEHLGLAGGLAEIPEDRYQDRYKNQLVSVEPRYVWAKEAVPSQRGSTKRVKLVVEPDSPLYKTTRSLKVIIDGVTYLTTGRVGERCTWGASSQMTPDG